MYKDRSAIIKKVSIHTVVVMTCIIASVIIFGSHKALAIIISALLCGIWFICMHKYKKRHPNDVQTTDEKESPSANVPFSADLVKEILLQAENNDVTVVEKAEQAEEPTIIVPNIPVKKYEKDKDCQPVERPVPSHNEHKDIGELEQEDNSEAKTVKTSEVPNESRENKNVIESDPEPEVPYVYVKPPLDCLSSSEKTNYSEEYGTHDLEEMFKSFNIDATVADVLQGPTVTCYEIKLAAGVRVSQVKNFAEDISLTLASPVLDIRPVPNKSVVGIYIKNKVRETVTLREMLENSEYNSEDNEISIAIGKDITGNSVYRSIDKLFSLLVSGTTGSGKSVCLNSMIVNLLYSSTPQQVKLLLIDTDNCGFSIFNGIPHLLVPIISDARFAAGALEWISEEITQRYNLFAKTGARDICEYNDKIYKDETSNTLPRYIIFIDDISNLLTGAASGIEKSILKIVQVGHACGVHIVITAQRPSIKILSGIIKANIPNRIAFTLPSKTDSRTVIDVIGADKLFGNGDMLLKTLGQIEPLRVQGCYISSDEIKNVVGFIKDQGTYLYDNRVINAITPCVDNSICDPMQDEMLPRVIEYVAECQMASTTLLQRKFKLGYARAARLMDALEKIGIVGPFEGSKPRKVLISKQQYQQIIKNIEKEQKER